MGGWEDGRIGGEGGLGGENGQRMWHRRRPDSMFPPSYWQTGLYMIRTFKELDVWRNAVELAMRVFECTQSFPREERYSLTDQVRRSSRSISANIAEAWHKRRYPASFVSKLSDAECEAAETQTWIEHALRCSFCSPEEAAGLDRHCASIIGQLVNMSQAPERWCTTVSRD